MASRLSRCITSLESAGFLRSLNSKRPPSLELLHHGSAYAKQLQQKWLAMRPLAVDFGSIAAQEDDSGIPQSCSSFVHSQQFRKHFQQLRQAHPSKAKCPALLKHQCPAAAAANSIFQYETAVTQLITDFFVEPHRGLEHFYNVQRESKIWWMRYSSNPSRYAIVPHQEQSEACQTIDVRADFADAAAVTVEQLSLVTLPELEDFLLPDARTGKLLRPMVIRSTIELEPATCALLLDGCDHARETESLLLNRLLAPYQCAVAGIQKSDEISVDLRDLCEHMVHVVQHAGLRLQLVEDQEYALATDEQQLRQQLQLSDWLGVPYTLLLDEQQTLSNGLLRLRSRDTQLAETIHISDLPDYLLNIFRNY
ncbi:hypothetical protein KR222_002976 [Zaprionus bogoriensis]|nr:hypothetical protein KR222_002976 [Zaprionus bogoriensis]